MQNLKLSLIQTELAWEAPADNRQQFERLIRAQSAGADVVVLPEMFTTGFSMKALANAEPEGGPTEAWMRALAQEIDGAVCGSIAVQAGEAVYNRFLFVTPNASHHYDKRHLFRMAGEHNRYAAGSERVIVPWRNWRINLQVCYDLRFPVFSRARGDYDLLLYVANWPAARREHWQTLLRARAIENQACVVGVNRLGSDANGITYTGDSTAIAADGSVLTDLANKNGAARITLDGAALATYRQQFPCHLDADAFELS